MKTAEDVESYLLKLGLPYEQARPGTWILRPERAENLVVSTAGPVVAFRMKVMELPAAHREELYKTLLELNTTEMVHAAFGLEGKAVVLVCALELENLDWNEFSAVIDDMTLAIAKHYPKLSKYLAAA